MQFKFYVKPFSFRLVRKLKTSKGIIEQKSGWLLRLEDEYKKIGWGEISPIYSKELNQYNDILQKIGDRSNRETLEACIKDMPNAIGFGIGAALSEIDGIIGTNSWLKAPQSSFLITSEEKMLDKVNFLLNKSVSEKQITLKWKVNNAKQIKEIDLLIKLLKLLPSKSRLRIDANGSWNREQANQWANILENEKRLEWLEQPLDPFDIEGLSELSKQVPVALDESLICNTSLIQTWKGWQIRRPCVEGDPRILLKELENGVSYRVISTSFETGIGGRWVNHLSSLQQKSSTPTAPGLAPGWTPTGSLFSSNPQLVWDAA